MKVRTHVNHKQINKHESNYKTTADYLLILQFSHIVFRYFKYMCRKILQQKPIPLGLSWLLFRE